MLKKLNGKISKSLCKVADELPYGVLATSAVICMTLIYAKGHTDAIKIINKSAEEANLDLKITY